MDQFSKTAEEEEEEDDEKWNINKITNQVNENKHIESSASSSI